ncbi:hypothetical protein PAEPH01_1600 [Pancytospora epiphaga]|nr:hypothetical protein PAEPH01_1600 [Pancytospora epiphaga]
MLLEITNELRAKIKDPRRRLCSQGLLLKPLIIKKESITSMQQMSRHIVSIYCTEVLYVSNACNQSVDMMKDDYDAIKVHRFYNGVYYDIQLITE